MSNRFLKAVAFLGCVSPSFAVAQSNGTPVPVNFPPDSFTGAQYVDNNGCIFVRAGFDGATTWVPRVNRQREQICGLTPTFSGAAAQVTTQPAPPPVEPPVQITVDTTPDPAPEPVAVAPTPQAPEPAVVSEPAPAAAQAPAPRPRVVTRARPAAPASQPRRVVRAPVVKQPAMRETRAPAPSQQVQPTRIIPRHVADARDFSPIQVPKGFRPAWDDDRLNPHRAIQTPEGYRQTQQVWTNTVPRKKVSAAGQAIKEPKIVGRQSIAVAKPVLSTRSAPAKPALRGARLVEIGVFSTPQKARAAAQRLANRGLPAKMSNIRYKGQTMTRVVLGPFKSASAAERGLRSARQVGYTRARLK